jgi:hypothetical protein
MIVEPNKPEKMDLTCKPNVIVKIGIKIQSIFLTNFFSSILNCSSAS